MGKSVPLVDNRGGRFLLQEGRTRRNDAQDYEKKTGNLKFKIKKGKKQKKNTH